MNTYTEKIRHTGMPEYEKHFWNAMRGKDSGLSDLSGGLVTETATYQLPNSSINKYMTALEKQSVFRNIATVVRAYGHGYKILAKDCPDFTQWVMEGEDIPIYDGVDDFSINSVNHWKLAALVKLDEAFVNDAGFDIENHIITRFAKSFGRAEDDAFINGTGNQMPTGILNATGGADVGITTAQITYDNIISLYYSVKPEYRKNAVWLMNDETALALRSLKDSSGSYLWQDSDDKILGKNVIISEFMPNAESGRKPVAFGDFSYYWIVGRSPISIRTLTEKFAIYDQIAYLAFESLDGKIIRPEAIKVLQLT